MACNGYLPRFQPQNPNRNGDPYGWSGCTAYSAAMAAAFDSCGAVDVTGQYVRSLTNEPVPDPRSPGLNLGQVDVALRKLGVDLDTEYRVPWDVLQRRIGAGQGAVLQISTGPFLNTTYRSTAGAIGHAIFVPPGWGVMDPAADGRYSWVHKYDGKSYPLSLIRKAAGALKLGTGTVGIGYAYAAFTRDQRSTFGVNIRPANGAVKTFYVYTLKDGVITARRVDSTRGFSATCSQPRLYRWPGHTSKSLVQLTSGSRTGRWIDSRYAVEVP